MSASGDATRDATRSGASDGASDGAWEELAPGVLRRRLPGWDETVGAVAGRRHVLLVDAGPSLRAGAEIRLQLRGLLGRPVDRVALTHGHFDHVLGAAAFAGAEVYGAVGLGRLLGPDRRDAVAAEAVAHGADRRAAEEAADVLVRPGHEVARERELDLDGPDLDGPDPDGPADGPLDAPGNSARLVAVGPGHTACDLAVLVPARAGAPPVVFCGDLVEESGAPQAGPDARPDRWPAALDRLLELGGPHARYVPGHGAVVDAAFVRAQRDALARRFGARRERG